MLIIDNTIKDKCFICKRIEVIHKMFIFSKQLYCFQCSIEKLKGVYKNDYRKKW